MDQTELSNEIAILAAEIREIDRRAAERLDYLNEALQSVDDQTVANAGLSKSIDPAGIEEQAIIHHQGHWFHFKWAEWLRNILILTPVAITWFGLAVAASNYRTAIKANDALRTEPFLNLWEQNFQGLGTLPGPTFSGLAFLDFAILVVVIILTLFIHYWKDIKVNSAEKRAADLRQRIEHALWSVDRQTSSVQAFNDPALAALEVRSSVDKFGAQTQEILESINAEQDRLMRIGQQREQELNHLEIFSVGLTKGASDLVRYGQNISVVNNELQTSIKQLIEQLELDGQQQQRMLDSFELVGINTDTLVTTVQGAVRDLEGGISNLNASSNQQTANIGSITNASREMGNLATALLQGENSLRAGILQASTENQDIISSLESTAKSVAGTVSQTNQIVGALSNIEVKLDRHVESMNRLGKGMSLIATRQNETSQAAGQAIKSFQSVSDRLATVIVSMIEETGGLNEAVAESTSKLDKRLLELEVRSGAGPQPRLSKLPWLGWGLLGILILMLFLFSTYVANFIIR